MASAVHTPLTIYVLYHQDSDEARALAHGLHDWFRLKTDDGERSESGLPIWFRCRVKVCAKDYRSEDGVRRRAQAVLEPEIVFKEAEDNVVVILADRHMVADLHWRHALEHLCAIAPERENAEGPHALILPVEVHRSLHQLPYVTAERNALRIGDPIPARLTRERDEFGWRRRIEERVRMLRRAVTESIARELVIDRRRGGTPQRLSVFLSHAKRDGRRIAEAVRDGLAAYGQLRVWYDSNDLPAGYEWAQPMGEAAGSLSAVLSIVTDAYPSRPWCREEVRQARTPRRIGADGMGAVPPGVSIWHVRPLVAVHQAGANWSRAMAPLVHVPAIGWDDDDVSRQQRIADVADRLVLEMLVANFYRRIAEHLVRGGRSAGASKRSLKIPTATHVVLLTWVPEPWSVTRLLDELLIPRAPVERAGADGRDRHGAVPQPLGSDVQRLVLAYPGHGLRPVEERELQEIIDGISRIRGSATPDGTAATRLVIKLTSQERLQEQLKATLSGDRRSMARREEEFQLRSGLRAPSSKRTRRRKRMSVCFSGGGRDRDLECAGVGLPHLDDLFLRLARRLLESDCRLVYGGPLSDLDRVLTVALIEAARAWVRDRGGDLGALGIRDIAGADQLDDVPFVNYSPWPVSERVGLEHEADLVGMCRFIPVIADLEKGTDMPQGDFGIRSPAGRRLMAASLEAMRKQTSELEVAQVRVLVGGRISDFGGWLPGIGEEAMRSVESGQLPLVIGGFGGFAGLLAEFLRSESEPWPQELTFERRKGDDSLRHLLNDEEVAGAQHKFAGMQAVLTDYRAQLHAARKSRSAVLGVSGVVADMFRLLDARSPTVVADLVVRVVRRAQARL